MKVGEVYRILGHKRAFRADLQPEGTIVKCVEDKGNGFFVIELIDNCGEKIEEGVAGWLVNIKSIYFESWKQQKI